MGKTAPYLPPMEERPICPYCKKRLRPSCYKKKWEGRYERSYKTYNWFCSDICAGAFADAAYNAGYRIPDKKEGCE